MKKIIIGILAVGMLLLFGAKPLYQLSKNSEEHVAPKSQLLKDALFEQHSEWEILIQKFEQAILSNETQLCVFKEKLEESGPKDLLLFSNAVNELEEENLVLKSALGKYKVEQQVKWVKFKEKFERDRDVLERKIKSIVKDR